MPRQRRRKPSAIELPLLPRRRGILFPNTSGPILVGRKTSLRAIDEASGADGIVAVVTQRDPSMSDLAERDVFPIATESVINRALRLPDGTTQVWVQGLRRLRVLEFTGSDPFYRVVVEPIDEDEDATLQTEALKRAVLALFEKVCKLAPSVPEDAYVMALNIERVGWFADYVASCLNLDDFEAEDLLSTLEARERLEKLSIHLAKELDVLELQTKIHSRVQEELDRTQREYFLREQMKAIQKELGENDPNAR
ncbi:MAG: LON peptidase substrate-binding domain-containing protein, partial [Dehalococcoidia bacterium]